MAGFLFDFISDTLSLTLIHPLSRGAIHTHSVTLGLLFLYDSVVKGHMTLFGFCHLTMVPDPGEHSLKVLKTYDPPNVEKWPSFQIFTGSS